VSTATLTPALLDLMDHEKVIEQGLATFIDVGNALLKIKMDRKYVAAGYATFEEYCEKRWDISRSRGYQLVAAATVVEGLARDLETSTIVDTALPRNEAQVRPLAKLPEADRAAAWSAAVDAAAGGQPTGAEVQAAVDDLTDDARRLLDLVATTDDEDLDDDDCCLECGQDLATGDHLPSCSDAAAPVVDDEAPSSSTGGGGDSDVEAAAPPPPPTPKPAPAQKAHPATYSNAILDVIAPWVEGLTVLDPFAGTGRIHELRARGAADTYGIELEAEWASLHLDTFCGDARDLLDHIEHSSIDAIVTSPAYGNRMADTYTDDSVRQTYTAALGRPLTDGNAGAMQWGDAYRDLHRDVWRVCEQALKPGGLFILNCKNHIRGGEIQRVTEWHVQELMFEQGLDLVAWDIVPTRGLPSGENHEQRVGFESVVVLRKAGGL
jgi:hypothetical protein